MIEVGEHLVVSASRGTALTGSNADDAVYIHTSTMESTGTCLGDCVVVLVDTEVRAVGTAWPSQRFKRSECSMSDTLLARANISIGAPVSIVRLVDALPLVQSIRVTLPVAIPGIDTEHALCLIQQSVDNKPAWSGWSVSFAYNGRERLALITSVTLANGTVSAPSTAPQDRGDLSDRLADVSLEGTENTRGRGRIRTGRDVQETSIVSIDEAVSHWRNTAVVGRCQPTTTVTMETDTNLSDDQSNSKDVKPIPKIGYNDIGGLRSQLAAIREMIELPLTQPSIFKQFGLPLPKGVLLYGLPGTGKTLIARAVANESGAHVEVINGTDILSKFYGESESRLREIFQRATDNAPSILFIDEIDALCPKRDDSASDSDNRVVATLLTLMDGMGTKTQGDDTLQPHVVVIGATNRPNAIDPALRRPGRFDRELEVPVPSVEDRLAILGAMLGKIPHRLTKEQIHTLASDAHGYVGADLAALCKEAAVHALNSRLHVQDNGNVTYTAPGTGPKSALQVQYEDMTYARLKVRPSALREVAVEVPRVLWTDIGGQEDVKQRLREAVSWPLLHPEAFVRMNIRPPKGVLLYGPPGTSKTMMAKALATESGLNFIPVKGPELFSKWVGDSEKAVREIFRRARATAPCIVFFDEIDSISAHRGGDSGGSGVSDRVLTQLLNELDGVVALKNVVVVAATNRPDAIDSALLRPGRIDRILYVNLPDAESRREIFSINLRRMPQAVTDEEVSELVRLSDGFSGAEVAAVCREAAMLAMREDPSNVSTIQYSHFLKAARKTSPRTTAEQITYYETYASRSGVRNV